jgi:hypothetical protein
VKRSGDAEKKGVGRVNAELFWDGAAHTGTFGGGYVLLKRADLRIQGAYLFEAGGVTRFKVSAVMGEPGGHVARLAGEYEGLVCDAVEATKKKYYMVPLPYEPPKL